MLNLASKAHYYWHRARDCAIHLSRNQPSSIESEKLFRGFGRGFRQFLQGNPSCTRDRFGHEAGISRLASFTPKWHRREIRTIGFHHEFPERNLCRNRPDGSAIFESHDPGKRNEMIEIEYFICLLERAAKAMKHAPHLVSVRPHHLECVIPGVALMNYDIELELDREIELLLKQYRLLRFISAIFDAGVDLFFRLTLQRIGENLHFLVLRRRLARQRMIIQTRFANRYYARTFRQLAQWRDHVVSRFFGISRMNT